tara:strand:- start:87 stop:362 length:276 start_codon:yes stop_codon:yes gene_type:complete
MKNFVIVGAAGYIAPKHLEAIKKTKNNLMAAYDIAENVGIIDTFFRNSKFFFKFDEFERYLIKNKKKLIIWLYVHQITYIFFILKLVLNII